MFLQKAANNRLKVTLIMCVLVLAPDHAYATVLEFDSEGKVIVSDKIKEQQKQKARQYALSRSAPDGIRYVPTELTLKQATYRKLAGDIALKHTTHDGLILADIDPLTFVTVFQFLIERESGFDPETVSEKGAQGLGQLMPETAKYLGVADPFDATENLNGSARYFAEQLKQFGSLDLALAAYNAGPQRVQEFGGIPPFKETRRYVSWVLQAAGLENPGPQRRSPVKVFREKDGSETTLLSATVAKSDVELGQEGISVWEFSDE